MQLLPGTYRNSIVHATLTHAHSAHTCPVCTWRTQFVARLLGMRLFRRSMGPSGLLLRDKLTFLLGTTMMWWVSSWLGVG